MRTESSPDARIERDGTITQVSHKRLRQLRALERKVLWLAVWMVHHANHVRPNIDGVKVGGHQASSASMVTLMTALYFDVLRPRDRVAVKPHASPVFHAIQYLFGRVSRAKLEGFRAYGGAQSYPSRTKDVDDVDFSTGSVGLGVAMTSFAALTQEYLKARQADGGGEDGRMVALLGDAEFDEGNVFEAVLEGWKHNVRNLWWVVDYNRQSLDMIVSDGLGERIGRVLRDMDWDVVTLKYGRLLEAAFNRRGGDALQHWLDTLPNADYSALAHSGSSAWRERLSADIGDTSGIRELLDEHDDNDLHALLTNLGGHDFECLLDAFHGAEPGRPTCFLAYTIKGYRLPFAGHKDNHSGLMSPAQTAALKRELGIGDGEEWDTFAGLDMPAAELTAAIAASPFNDVASRVKRSLAVAVPDRFEVPAGARMSTQDGFGRLLSTIAREHGTLADRIVTASPDVTVSTNLGPWVNRRGVFGAHAHRDQSPDAAISSPQKWAVSPQGQHIELGIAENNLFILLAALGLAGPLFGTRLLPIGTVYDPFICRGLDALNYACYQDARFILVATPSGLTLAPEGGAHQSIITPLIGIGQPGLTAFEPAYVDELAEILRWSFVHLQADGGESVYLRLSTRPLAQQAREMTPDLRKQVLDGGYWLIEPGPGAEVALVACGPVVREAIEAHERLAEDVPETGLLVVTSPDRLQRAWIHQQRRGNVGEVSHIERLLAAVSPHAGLVTILDGHPAALSWIGAVRQHHIVPLGVERFGQSGNVPDLYRSYGLDAEAIVDAVARICLQLAS